jgi:Ras-related protein Rab-6A
MKAHKIVVLGDSGVGKTSVINKIMNQKSSVSETPTIGIDFLSANVNTPSGSIRLQIWDTAGQEQFRSLIPSYLRGSTLAIVIYSVDSRESFDALPQWIHFLQNTADPPLIVVGNKTDLEGRVVSENEGKQFADGISAAFIETSALENRNIDTLVEAIVTVRIGDAQRTPSPVPVKETPNGSGGICGC